MYNGSFSFDYLSMKIIVAEHFVFSISVTEEPVIDCSLGEIINFNTFFYYENNILYQKKLSILERKLKIEKKKFGIVASLTNC